MSLNSLTGQPPMASVDVQFMSPGGASSVPAGGMVSSLASVTPAQVGAFADQMFLALGDNGIAALPFLTELIKASNGGASAPAASSAPLPMVDSNTATKQLMTVRNNFPGVAGLDAAIVKLSDALPKLTESEFKDAFSTLMTALQPVKQDGGKPETVPAKAVDALEMNLLMRQLAVSTGNKAPPPAAAASSTGNPVLDQMVQMVQKMSAEGLSSQEQVDLSAALSSLVSAMYGPEKAQSIMAPYSGPQTAAAGSAVTVSVGLGGQQQSAPAASSQMMTTAAPAAQAIGWDPMRFVLEELTRANVGTGNLAGSTNQLAFQYIDNAMKTNSGSSSASKPNAAVSMV